VPDHLLVKVGWRESRTFGNGKGNALGSGVLYDMHQWTEAEQNVYIDTANAVPRGSSDAGSLRVHEKHAV
jgi:hypothetical protein